ncbi:C1 family peptidase [Frankia sp. CiP1_Cm_nod2]|uniref:C1 family peptidase n=2 Tax=unclassified Frankia TaxID=2632575 RepID=UPI0020252338
MLYRKYEETVHEGMRLGRNLWLDARSLAYMVENDVAAMSGKLVDQLWDRRIVILDQGELGSCTGNAGTGALGTEPFYSAVGSRALPAAGNGKALEDFAVTLYKDATVVDGYPGTYPPDDTGSSGLAICKVLKSRGTIKGYRFARTAYGLLQLLQHGPVLQGMPWYAAFFHPDAAGFIDADPKWRSSGVAGGHEVEAIGVDLDTRNVFDSVIVYANSWGTGWGDNGLFRMRLRTYDQLSGVDLRQYQV